jgi:hypothetical protein
MVIPENEKSAKNPQNYAQEMRALPQKIKNKKQEINKRRNLVYQLDLQGYSNMEIAKQLQVSDATIERDLQHMRLHCLKWARDIIVLNTKKPMLDSYTRIEIAQKELWGLYRNEKDTKTKRQKVSWKNN